MCREPGANTPAPQDRNWINCDMNYRDMKVTCDDNAPGRQYNPGTRPGCPYKPMPMMETPNRSIVKEYSPYTFANARDQYDKTKYYNGTFSRGTPGGPDRIYNLLGNFANAPPSIANCVNQISVPQTPTNARDVARLERLQFDNCVNQYLLMTSPYVYQDSRARLINNPRQSAATISLETECQPLYIASTFKRERSEYDIREYLYHAWIKLLQDPDHRKHKSVITLPALIHTAINAVGIQIPNILDNQSEPHLPKGVKISSPIPMDKYLEPGAPAIRNTQIAATPYEKIFDPSHPFSPRWDFPFNERDFYSPMVSLYQNKWHNNSKAVYCAGVREAKNKTGKEKEDLEVKVDVLRFREKAFTEGVMSRIGFNTICKLDNSHKVGRYPLIPPERGKLGLLADPTTFCLKPKMGNVIGCLAAYYATCWLGCIEVGAFCNNTGEQLPCWECYKLKDKVDDETTFPPCTTRYDGKDRKIRSFPVLPGLRNEFRWEAPCRVVPLVPEKRPNMVTLCENLRKPYTQINRLKLRYHNVDDKDNNALIEGPAEGMSFSDYFGNHMPYPRIWDTGTSLHKTPWRDSNKQAPLDTTGQHTSIVGVGREGAPKSAGDEAQKKHPDERCRLGGWGPESVGGVPLPDPKYPNRPLYLPESFLGLTAFKLPDPVTSWTEFKAYQMRTMRLTNLTCIGRYEKVFKPGNTESIILAAAGGEWSRIIVQKCPRGKVGSVACNFMSLKEYKDAGSPRSDKDNYSIPQMKLESWPLAWRGYIASGTTTIAGGNPLTTGKDQFPNFGKGNTYVDPRFPSGVGLSFGLDKAELGDIIMMPRGSSKLGFDEKPGLPKLALVAEVNLPKPNKGVNEEDCTTRNDCYVMVLEADNGKWPDTCGTTDAFGELRSRYLYKPNNLPKPASEEYARIGWTSSCEDSNLMKCEFAEWDRISVYSIRKNLRAGCNELTSKECDEK